MVPRYTFGDTDIASQRLAVLAGVFGAPSAALLGSLPVVPSEVERVLDLGCGPGHTTAMLAAAFPSATVLGVDTSARFVEEARAAGHPARCAFAVADVTHEPLPSAPVDVVYARFLLSHLPDVGARIAAWAQALRPGGVLVLEEPEWIATDDADLRSYLARTTARVASQGADMFAGPLLTASPTPGGTARVLDRVTELDVAVGDAVAMFSLNLRAWGDATTADLLRRLEARLGDPSIGVIRWGLRQLVLRLDSST